MRKRFELKDLAFERIERLLEFAEKIHSIEPELADRYGSLAMAIARKARLRYPDFLKSRVCRKCGAFLVPGVTMRVRVKNRGKMKYISVTCLKCGYTRRYPLNWKDRLTRRPWLALYKRWET
ncbi:MAG: ribonuclease P protein component 4 [Infirmifilum sp.]|jgi:ribonuclease P protein subunit RPR2|uniref:ribonuclease P protein component 4 n=1 Tax=Infirmifilum TaxID=2856573 RepID=UPI002353C1F1